MTTLKFEQNTQAVRFLKSRARVQGIMGPVGGGKTTAVLAKIKMLIDAQAPSPIDGRVRLHITILRNTIPQLKQTTLPAWEEIFPLSLGKFTERPMEHVFPIYRDGKEAGECKAVFIPVDNKHSADLWRGLQTTFAWINEADQIDPKYFDMIDQRVGRYPPMMHGGPSWHGILMDTNAPSPDHWWYNLAEVVKPEDYAFFKQPPAVLDKTTEGPNDPYPINPAAENLRYLPENYWRSMQRGANGLKADWWISRYLKNEYVKENGSRTIYGEDYRDPLHHSETPVAPIPNAPLIVGVDFGLTPAAVFLQEAADGRVFVLDELVTPDDKTMGAARFGQVVAARLARPDFAHLDVMAVVDPAGSQRAQTDERCAMDVFATAAAIRARPAQTNLWTLRFEAVSKLLRDLVDGRPRFILGPKCVVLRKGFIADYHYEELANGTFSDVPAKNSASHVQDALQYGVLGLGVGHEVTGRKRKAGRRRQSRVESYRPN